MNKEIKTEKIDIAPGDVVTDYFDVDDELMKEFENDVPITEAILEPNKTNKQ